MICSLRVMQQDTKYDTLLICYLFSPQIVLIDAGMLQTFRNLPLIGTDVTDCRCPYLHLLPVQTSSSRST
jgi:hypothetical protein